VSISVPKKGGLRALLNRAKKDQRILAVLLFGSVARRRNHEGSDTDICLVLVPGAYTPLQLSRTKLEYLQDFDQDVHVFQQLPLYIRKRVLKDGKILYSRDTDSLYEVAFTFIREYADYEHIYHDYLGDLSRAG
jgi:predicted nucleotidyltransferase